MSGKQRRPPAKISERYLRWHTERYLSRYTTTRAHLQRLLMERVRRSAAHHQVPIEPWAELVEAELDRLCRLGLVDDGLFARDRARALHRRGNGERAIQAKLAAKGLRGEVVDEALRALGEGSGDPELEAARTWARKRRLGPWARQPVADPDERRRQLARFGRAGFSYGVAVRVLDSPPE